MSFSRRSALSLSIVLLLFLVDYVSKSVVDTHLPLMGEQFPYYPYGGVGVFQNFFGIEFSISHTVNRGAAWGVFSNYQSILLWVRILFLASLTLYLLFYNREKWAELPLLLIVGGAAGNVVDTFIYGHVVDMFHFAFWGYHYPVFNVADSMIFVGIVLMIILPSLNGGETVENG